MASLARSAWTGFRGFVCDGYHLPSRAKNKPQTFWKAKVCATRLANGYTGQTPETLALPGEGSPFERIVGVPLKSYVTLSWTYHFRRRIPPSAR